MKKFVILLVAIAALNTTLSAQIFIDARSMGIPYGEPKMMTAEDNANISATARFDADGKITSFEYGEIRMTFSWRPDGKRITFSFDMNGETMLDYINIIEYSDKLVHYEYGGETMKLMFDSLGRIEEIERTNANQSLKMEHRYEAYSSASAATQIVVTNNIGQTAELQVYNAKYDAMGNYTEYTTISNGFEAVSKRKIYYY